MASKVIRTKRVFISDIHMGDQQSVDPPGDLHPYGWFHQDRGRMLGDFLGLKLNDLEVKEVIILGDLFDLWVYPAELEPPDEKEHLKRIAHAYQNRGVIRGLRAIAACDEIDLIYVQGNHDMWTSTMTIPCWKEFLNELFPGINTDYMEKGIFEPDGIVAEHGNKYCLFNASGRSGNPGNVLPLGYFITRVVTEKVAKTGESVNSLDVLWKIIEEYITDRIPQIKQSLAAEKAEVGIEIDREIDWLIKHFLGALDKLVRNSKFAGKVFDAIRKDCCLTEQSQIEMDDVDGYAKQVSVNDIKVLFGDLYDNWNGKIPSSCAVVDEHLLQFAVLEQQWSEGDIVILGHTHKPVIAQGKEEIFLSILDLFPRLEELWEEFIDKEKPEPEKSGTIYANCGTWINGEDCTFVETEIKDGRHYVRSKQYKEDGTIHLLGERYIISQS